MRRLIPLFALAVVLLTACRAEVTVGMDIESSGAGTVALEIGVDDELQSLIESTGGSIDDLVGELPEGATAIEPRQQGDLTVYGFTRPFSSPDELQATLDEGFEGVETGGSDLELVVEDGGATLDATLVIPDASAEAGDLGELAGSLQDFLAVAVRVHLPGEVVESNADRTLDDGSLVWDLPVTGGTVEIQARSEAGGGFPVVPVVVGVGVLALAGVVGYLFARRSKGEGADAIAATVEPPAPAPVFDDATAPAPADPDVVPAPGSASVESPPPPPAEPATDTTPPAEPPSSPEAAPDQADAGPTG